MGPLEEEKSESSTSPMQTVLITLHHECFMQYQRQRTCLFLVLMSAMHLVRHTYENKVFTCNQITHFVNGGFTKGIHPSLTDLSYQSCEPCKDTPSHPGYGKSGATTWLNNTSSNQPLINCAYTLGYGKGKNVTLNGRWMTLNLQLHQLNLLLCSTMQ